MAAWATEAARNTLLKYAPKSEALAQLQQAAAEQYAASVQQGKQQGLAGEHAAERAAPEVKGIYDRAATEGARGRSLIQGALNALAPDNPFRLAQGNEEAAGNERLQSTRAHAESAIATQKSAAASVPAFARQNAYRTLLKELSTLSGKKEALQGEEALSTQTEIDRAKKEAAKEGATERREGRKETATERREANAAKQAEKREAGTESRAERRQQLTREIAEGKNPGLTPGGARTGGKSGFLPQKEQNAAAATVAQIRQIVGKNPGRSRAEYVAKLTEGFPEEKEGTTVKAPAIKGFKPDPVMSAALDWAEYGYINPHHERELIKHHYDPKQLGIPSEAEFKKAHPERHGAGSVRRGR